MADYEAFKKTLDEIQLTFARIAVPLARPGGVGELLLGDCDDARCTLPDAAISDAGRRAWLAVLWRGFAKTPSPASSQASGDRSRWAKLVFSFLGTLDETYVHILADGRVRPDRLTRAQGAHLEVYGEHLARLRLAGPAIAYRDSAAQKALARDYGDDDDPEAERVYKATAAVEEMVPFGPDGGMPLECAPMSADFAALAGPSSIPFALAGIIIFLAGRIFTSPNKKPIPAWLPAGLVQKFGYSGIDLAVLTGPSRIADGVHDEIDWVWRSYPSARREMIKHVAHMSDRTLSENEDALTTTALRLEWIGMAHVRIIDDFLEAHPRAVLYQRIASEIQTYRTGLRALGLLPKQEQPFTKVIYSDSVKILKQRNLSKLFGIALCAQTLKEPTLRKFARPAGAQAEFELYNAWAAAKRVTDEENSRRAVARGLPPPQIHPEGSY